MKGIINTEYLLEIERFKQNLSSLKDISEIINHQEMKSVVDNLDQHAENPFMFVVVGEVKAGKSSFINALLESEKEICKVAASPMTDTIQLITYGEDETVLDVNEFLKKIQVNAEILKSIAIVDTPGTNSIVKNHQEITERFIPYADLIVFVFEAKNPYRQSAWEFFDYISDQWRRKVVFVLQQKDLLSIEDLNTNIQGVKDFAVSKGIHKPNIFAVSAMQELKGLKSESGYLELKDWIESNITGDRASMLKLNNLIETSTQINSKLTDSLSLRIKQYESDLEFRKDIQDTLDYQENKTKKQIDMLSDAVLASYDNIMNEKIEVLSDGLSFTSVIKRSIGSIFGGDNSFKEWLNSQAKDLELQLNITLKDKLQNGIIDVADNIQMMGKLVDSKIRSSKTILNNNDEIFSEIAERRANVLKELQESFSNFLKNTDNFYDENMINESNKMTPNLLTGSGIAVVGVILATVVNGAVFDITGGILTTIGVLFAGVSLGLQKNKITKRLKSEASEGKEKIKIELNDILTNYTHLIKNKINANFTDFDRLLSNENEVLSRLESLQSKFVSTNKEQHLRIINAMS
jgi:GTPase SAR1 family protein